MFSPFERAKIDKSDKTSVYLIGKLTKCSFFLKNTEGYVFNFTPP